MLPLSFSQVVDMLVSAMRVNDSIEMRVIDGRSRDAYAAALDPEKQPHTNGQLNTNNNNNNHLHQSSSPMQPERLAASHDELSESHSSNNPFDIANQHRIATSYSNLPAQLKPFDTSNNRHLSGSVPALATGK